MQEAPSFADCLFGFQQIIFCVDEHVRPQARVRIGCRRFQDCLRVPRGVVLTFDPQKSVGHSVNDAEATMSKIVPCLLGGSNAIKRRGDQILMLLIKRRGGCGTDGILLGTECLEGSKHRHRGVRVRAEQVSKYESQVVFNERPTRYAFSNDLHQVWALRRHIKAD